MFPDSRKTPFFWNCLEGQLHRRNRSFRRMITVTHRPRGWLLNGVRKIEQLRFFGKPRSDPWGKQRCKWAASRSKSSLYRCPNIYDEKQLSEFAIQRADTSGTIR